MAMRLWERLDEDQKKLVLVAVALAILVFAVAIYQTEIVAAINGVLAEAGRLLDVAFTTTLGFIFSALAWLCIFFLDSCIAQAVIRQTVTITGGRVQLKTNGRRPYLPDWFYALIVWGVGIAIAAVEYYEFGTIFAMLRGHKLALAWLLLTLVAANYYVMQLDDLGRPKHGKGARNALWLGGLSGAVFLGTLLPR
ncbi:MAG: hypothetical protein HY556_09590 [Euryarchaeota archaeon]|nr:hypothetical protein [Euryarchaeota archaeon]